MAEDRKRTKDVIFSDGSRATYLFDQDAKKYNETPNFLIKKSRLDDVNIKAGVGLPDASIFKSDVRVSFNTEVP